MSTDGLYRLLAWVSAAFPTGGFSYSHGLEAAAADGAVHDRESLERWIVAVVAKGSGRVDADILRDAWRAAAAGDEAALAEANRRGCAYRASAELALESSQQGSAFVAAYEAAWAKSMGLARSAHEICHAAAFGAATARAGIGLSEALTGYLHAFGANLMSAGLRLGLIGQNDGQRILAALELVVAGAVVASLARGPEDFGAATFAADLASMAHETQYSRLFRS
ncbi:MAG TPA: urease accessory UreF family protein [Stellaceae bacterium]|nr:urease accessory UreF family protein [Stellaceae bacterium]